MTASILFDMFMSWRLVLVLATFNSFNANFIPIFLGRLPAPAPAPSSRILLHNGIHTRSPTIRGTKWRRR